MLFEGGKTGPAKKLYAEVSSISTDRICSKIELKKPKNVKWLGTLQLRINRKSD